MFDHREYLIRRKVLKIFGASFRVYDPSGNVIGFSRQKAFKLKEDIRVFQDEAQSTELMSIQARQILDWSAAYDVIDSAANRKIGAARRKGFKPVARNTKISLAIS